jgi:hypothetical protein
MNKYSYGAEFKLQKLKYIYRKQYCKSSVGNNTIIGNNNNFNPIYWFVRTYEGGQFKLFQSKCCYNFKYKQLKH